MKFLRIAVCMLFFLLLGVATQMSMADTPEPERKILFIGRMGDDLKLYTISPTDSDAEPELFLDLTAYGRLRSAKLSPDETQLAFLTSNNDTLEQFLYILHLPTQEITEVRRGFEDTDSLNWSVDSRDLMYLGDGVIGYYNRIFRYNTQTKTEEELFWRPQLYQTKDFDNILHMKQSPNGETFIFAVMTEPPVAYLYFLLINADGTNPRELTIPGGSIPFAWNSQSDMLYFNCWLAEICSFDLTTHQVETVVQNDALLKISSRGLKELMTDDNQLIIDYLIGSELAIVDLDTGDVVQLLADQDYEVNIIGWVHVSDPVSVTLTSTSTPISQ